MAFPPRDPPDISRPRPWLDPTQPHQVDALELATQRQYATYYERSGSPGARARVTSTLVQPVAQVDRDYAPDEREIWGYTADVVSTTAPPDVYRFPAVAILAGARDVFIHKWEWMVTNATSHTAGLRGAQVHLTKALDPSVYNPVADNPGQFYPFYIARQGFDLPQNICIAGQVGSLPSILIDDVVVAPAIGPRGMVSQRLDNLVPYPVLEFQTMLDWQQPPLLLGPFEMAYMQCLNPSATVANRLWCNMWVSERER